MSGGGDSVALLHIAADWARGRGRRLLALTVDHGLNPDSADWTAFAGRAARQAGADWRGLRWDGEKPLTGLPAAARAARHRLIAEAARTAGARVVLFAHTADDIAEAAVMRAQGSSLGRLRDWVPSPAWPEGRGLMLLRPMLGAGRAEIRAWLAARGADWIEDPANEDMRFARTRARAALGPSVAAGSHPPSPAPRAAREDATLPFPSGDGGVILPRDADPVVLAAALVCVGGGDRLPRGDRLAGIMARLEGGEAFTAVLCGARAEAAGERILLTREAGEFARRPLAPLSLTPGVEAVWDGRWAITVDAAGWSVVPAAGRMASLSGPDRALLKALPSAARGAAPVLIRNDGTAPVLARRVAKARSLVEERLALALDRMTHERDLGDAAHGASSPNPLFCT